MPIKGGRKRHRRTKKHHRRTTKHKRRRHKRRGTKHKRGGGLPSISPIGGSPAAPFSGRWGGKMAAFPPGPIYAPGINNDAKFYGKLNKPILPDPTTTHGSGVTKKHGKVGGSKRRRRGGRKSRRGGRKSRRGGRKSRRGGRKGRGKKGGNVSNFLANNVPGFSDIRDLSWKGGEVLKSGYNTWFGYSKPQNTSAGIQPIGNTQNVMRPDMPNIPSNLKSGSLQAKKYNVA